VFLIHFFIQNKTIVHLAICFTLLIIPEIAQSQTDTLQYSEETQQDSMVQYLTPLEYAFMMHEETPWMVKVNLVLNNAFYLTNVNAFIEGKVGTAFTLSAGLAVKSIYSNSARIESIRIQSLLMFEPRWYYNMNKRVRAGNVKSNMSGNYLGLGVGFGNEFIYTYYNEGEPDSDEEHIKENLFLTTVYAKWGVQRRFLKRGYIDFGFDAQYEFYPGNEQTGLFVFSTFLNAGLAFAKDNEKLDRDKLCPVLRCYAADRYLVKANLISFFTVGFSQSEFFSSFNPQIAFELKLGESPFSLNADIRLSDREGRLIQYNLDHEFKFYANLDGRWYYNLNRRMLKGKTGNGLSANYFSFGFSYRLEKFFINSEFLDPIFPQRIFTDYNAGIQFLTGIQRTYAKHFYFDVNLGVRIFNYLDEGFNPVTEFAGLIAIGYRL